jgi:cytochrome c553
MKAWLDLSDCKYLLIKVTTTRFAFAILPLATIFASPLAEGADTPPAWAYPISPADFTGPDDGVPRRVPNSSITYTLTQLRDRFIASDWHPEDHPPMPPIVAKGRKPDVFACGFCHRADGPGSPQNAALAGLPAAYIVQQMNDYKSGARTTAVPGRGVQLMIDLAKAATNEEIAAAAAYFSALKPKQHTRVVETDIVPKTFLRSHSYAALPSGEKEAIGKRIIEVPENLEQVVLHDSRARFIAYVPVGSVAKGETLVKTGGAGKTLACVACHGLDLKGAGLIPGIAGRSTSYVVRQLYDFKHGFRAFAFAVQMKDVVARLDEEDMLAIAAYLATQAP